MSEGKSTSAVGPKPGTGPHEIIALKRPFAACGKLAPIFTSPQIRKECADVISSRFVTTAPGLPVIRHVNQDQRWLDWLYERHSQTELTEWALSLEYFRYCRAYGGHANDGDELKVALRYSSEGELRSLCEMMRIPLEEMPPDAPRPVTGVSYRGDEFAKFLSYVDNFPHIRQPGQVSLNGVSCFAWIYPRKIELSIADASDPYEVTPRCVEGARAIEPLLRRLSGSIDDPPRDNKHCICPKYYPGVWALHLPNKLLERTREK